MKLSTKKLCVIILSGLIVCLGIFMFIFTYNTPLKKFKRAIYSQDTKLSTEIYNQNSDNPNFKQNVERLLIKYIEQIQNDCITEKESTASLEKKLETILLSLPQQEKTDEIIQCESICKKSINAEKYYQGGNFLGAIELYSDLNTTQINGNEHNEINKKIDDCKNKISQSCISNASAALSVNDFNKAYAEMTAVNFEYLTADAIDFLDLEIIKKANEEIVNTANDLIEDNEYKEAYDYIASYTDGILLDQAKDLKKFSISKYVDTNIESAEALVLKEDYMGAESLLSKISEEIDDQKLKEQIRSCQKQIDTMFLESVNSKLEVTFDKMTEFYAINFADSYMYNDYVLSYYDTISDGITSFGMTLLYYAPDWRFVDKVIFNCDGSIFNFNFSYGSIKRTYRNGLAFETIVLFHNPEYADDDPNDEIVNLKELAEALVDSTDVTLRISGENGYSDSTIPQKEIEKFYTIWEIAEILNRNPELISILNKQ